MEKNKQHYIPRFYLGLFTDSKTPINQKPYVWILDRKKCSIKNRAPRNIAFKNGFNNIIDENGKISKIIEDEFGKIETKASTIIKKLINIKCINKSEQLELCKFIYTMRLRTPYFKDTFKEIIKTREYRSQFDKYMGDVDISPELAMDSVIRTCNLTSHYLLKMNWSLLIAPNEGYFITSDNPVVVLDPEAPKLRFCGFTNSEETKIIFPLSPKVCLYGAWKEKRIVEHLSKDSVDELNFEIFKYSYNYLYSSVKYFDESILMCNMAVSKGLIK
ncbi:DUF4238 domain-containing protein [Clostridium sporogenes]|uniref:DUF4238 domain-containing protein n=1 Tax=Clostridium sporogenes TaxID=1509 RepID=UPI002237F21F|nr:DUF4238 domain-containing protein [Clostridium sporogenes]MCW6111617.1 DUF4238 domain-containing protein [Clostridium sporogenes]